MLVIHMSHRDLELKKVRAQLIKLAKKSPDDLEDLLNQLDLLRAIHCDEKTRMVETNHKVA